MLIFGARRRGLGWIVYLFIRGISRGDPVYIAIAVGLVLVIGGYAYFKFRSRRMDVENIPEPKPYGDTDSVTQLGANDVVNKD